MNVKLITLLISIFLMGCSKEAKRIDARALLDVDRDFSKLSAIKGMNHAFAAFVAEDGVILRNNSYPIVGKEQVIARLNENPDTTFRLTWEPMYADMAQSGELGYTYGTYLIASLQGDSLGVGTYVSIWKKNEDDQWKFVFDAGNDGL